MLSILVVSVILSVSLGIFDIMTKELKLSGLGRESQIAFYAADAGVECFSIGKSSIPTWPIALLPIMTPILPQLVAPAIASTYRRNPMVPTVHITLT